MRTVFHWLNKDGKVAMQMVRETGDGQDDWRDLSVTAHRVYKGGRLVKDNCGNCPKQIDRPS
jgi:hypothetical protein